MQFSDHCCRRKSLSKHQASTPTRSVGKKQQNKLIEYTIFVDISQVTNAMSFTKKSYQPICGSLLIQVQPTLQTYHSAPYANQFYSPQVKILLRTRYFNSIYRAHYIHTKQRQDKQYRRMKFYLKHRNLPKTITSIARVDVRLSIAPCWKMTCETLSLLCRVSLLLTAHER